MSYDFPNEHAAAFDLSRREFDNGMRAVRALTCQGLHVVTVASLAHCRLTDAILGVRFTVISSHPSRELAQRAASGLPQLDAESAVTVFPHSAPDPDCDPCGDDIDF